MFKAKDNQVGELLMEAKHDLGYCPARFFWNDPMSLDKPDIKQSPVTKELDRLDWYLFFTISKRNLDTYGAYPIYWGYQQDCDFHNDECECDGGFLKDRKGNWMYDNNGLLMQCPVCSQKRLTGAGSFVEIPVPDPNAGQPDLSNPVGMLSVDRSSLDYNKTEEKDNTVIITVNDNGIGAHFTDRQREHYSVGIENARKRLEIQCGGALEICFTEGGCTAVITLPKEAENTEVNI